MTETTFAQRWAGESQRLPYWEAGAGETIVAILDGQRLPTRAHTLLAERRRVIVFAMTADAGSPQGAARQVGAAVAALGIERFDLISEGAGAAAAVWLALAPKADIGSVVLAAPDSVLGGPPDEAFREIKRPVFVYDAGPAIGAERPEELAFIALEFFERRDLFLVSRESGVVFP